MKIDVKLAIYGAIACVTTGALGATAGYVTKGLTAADVPQDKCYGISAPMQNDCQTVSNSCAGTSATDRQWDAFVMLPKGLCKKISGGNLAALKLPPPSAG
jgi:uncharacterized membrane protein